MFHDINENIKLIQQNCAKLKVEEIKDELVINEEMTKMTKEKQKAWKVINGRTENHEIQKVEGFIYLGVVLEKNIH